MSIQNSDLLDEGLQNVMGKDRCQPDWKPSKKPMVEPYTRTMDEDKKVQKPTEKAVDASWAPVKEPNWMDNMKSCAKSVLLFGGLSFLIFYWQQAGLMASSIAVPSMCVCTAIAGFGAGRTVRRGVR